MAKQTRLSVHKNTIEKRRKKEIANEITRMGAKMCKDNDIRAYALVGIDAEGKSHCIWDTGNILPMWAFPEVVAAMLRREMEDCGIEEDWKPQLPIKS